MEGAFGDGLVPAVRMPSAGREAMTEACREFGISRKTGYKIVNRYKAHGLEALSDRSRRPVRYANQVSQHIESLIVELKRDKPR